jgi:NAD-dependent deacetylase
MIPITTQAAIQQAAILIKAATSLLAFTGAGISADSGMPTFRGPGGIYGSYNEQHLELGFFKRDPATAWKTIRAIFFEFTMAAQPNDAHRILAAWEQAGRLSMTVTQNIDGLHRRAGSQMLSEFHGSCDELVCLSCGERRQAERDILAKLPPRCTCGGIYKPDFTFFGEGIPQVAYSSAMRAAQVADTCLIIGSTGSVYPAASIPRQIKQQGGAIIEINPEASEFTEDIVDVFIPLGAAAAMRLLDAALSADVRP